MKQRNEIPEALFDKIERYLTKAMDVDEQEEFRNRLRNDPELSDQVNEFRTIIEGIETQALKEKMNEFHRSISGVPTEVRSSGSRYFRLSYKIIAVAASIVVLLGLGGYWYFYQNSPNALYNTYFSPDPGLATVMGDNENFDFYDAMVNYKYGDYSLALNKWEEQLKTKPSNDTLNYFVGVTKMALKVPKSAIPNLEKVAGQSSSIFYNEAQFYLGLAFLKNDDMDNALKHLAQSDLKEARDLITELKK